MKKINVGALIVALLIPVLVGVVSAALSSDGMAAYATMKKPPLSPPAWVFPVAWTILYLMMGLASYFVAVAKADGYYKKMAFVLYGIQLALNFCWSIIFFSMGMYLFAFVWLVIMWLMVIGCTVVFVCISRVAGSLMVPYILWLTFAAYLNMGSYILADF